MMKTRGVSGTSTPEELADEALDPLSILRNFTRNVQEMADVKKMLSDRKEKNYVPLMEGDKLRIGHHLLDSRGPIALKGKKDKPFCLLAIWLMMLHEEHYGKYIAVCSKLEVDHVTLNIRTALSAYMKGETETCKLLDQALLEQQTADRKARREKRQDSELMGGLAEEPVVIPGETKQIKDWGINEIMRNEKPLVDTNTLIEIRGNKTLADVVNVFKRAEAELKKAEEEEKQTKSNSKRKPEPSSSRDNHGKKRPREDEQQPKPKPEVKGAGVLAPNPASNPLEDRAVPIIIVPEALTSMFNMYNIQQFLQKGEYVTVEEGKQHQAKKPNTICINRKSVLNPKENARWLIVDDVTKLKPDDWRRVVSVIVAGPTWQFKKWPSHLKTSAEWFGHALGVHFYFDDELPKPTVKDWNVVCKPLNKIKRYLDRGVSLWMWDKVDEFLAINNKERRLFY